MSLSESGARSRWRGPRDRLHEWGDGLRDRLTRANERADPVAQPAQADLRLLGIALVVWALAAATWLTPVWVPLGLAAIAIAAAGWACRSISRAGRHHRSRGRTQWVAAAGILTALVLVSAAGQRSVDTAGGVEDLAGQGAVATLEAQVTSDPREVGHGPTRSMLLTAVVRSVVARGTTRQTAAPIVAFVSPRWADRVRYGATVRVTGRLKPPLPGDDAVAALTITSAPALVSPPSPVLQVAGFVRERLGQAVDGLPADARGLVPGLVVGDTSRTPDDLTDAMKQANLTHLCAVSGSNVTIVITAALALCGECGVRRRWRPWVAVAMIVAFVIVARPEPSVVRAGVMGGVAVIGMAGDRSRSGLSALGAAVVTLLVVSPSLARSFGFALSVLATLGILLFARPWGEAMARRLPAVAAPLAHATAIPLAAQAMCGPVMVLLAPSVSVIGIPANVVAAPLVAPATIAGVIVGLLAVISPSVASLAAWSAGVPALGIAAVARGAAGLEGGRLPWPSGAGGALLLAGLTVVVILTGRRWWWLVTRRPVLAAIVLVLVAGAAAPLPVSGWPMAGWRLVMCDVGQGDGLVARTGPEQVVVVDVGPDGRAMVGCLRRLGVHRIDAIVLTHFHADHVDGLAEVLDALPVTQLVTGSLREPPEQARQVSDLAVEHRVPIHLAQVGQRLTFGDFTADVIGPLRTITDGSPPNNNSLVLMATIGGTRVALTGDIEPEQAGDLRRRYGDSGALRADVLKVPHHGSAKQDPGYLALVHARLALVSVGRDNDYGMPTATALAMLQRLGVTVVRTDLSGDVAVTGAGDALGYTSRGPP